MQWKTLFHKEMLENWRNYNWIWVPLVIIVLAIMDPLTNYYLPEIIEAVGGVPEGAVFEIPTPTAQEAMMMSLSQLSTLGVLIFTFITMGTIAGERRSGVAEVIFTRSEERRVGKECRCRGGADDEWKKYIRKR